MSIARVDSVDSVDWSVLALVGWNLHHMLKIEGNLPESLKMKDLLKSLRCRLNSNILNFEDISRWSV